MSLLLFAPTAALTAQSSPPKLSDPEVAHVAVTANTIDIDAARLAQAKTGNKNVKQFAATMITDHSAVNAQATALATKLGVTPEDNAVSHSLLKGASDARTTLEALKGKAFDKAYIDREVSYHQAVLDALDKMLIPDASNAELKKLLMDVRPAIAAHLEHAKKLQSELGGKSA
jgi:putative membrane protein